MKIELAVDDVVKTLTYGGLSFYNFGTITGWSPDTDDKYKFGKGAQVLDAEVTAANITQKRAHTVELDLSVTMSAYTGDIYALLKPVGGRGGC